jgi:hypothetical protein
MTAYQQHSLFTAQPSAEIQSAVMDKGESETPSRLSQFDMIDQLIGQFRQREQAIVNTKIFIENAFNLGVMNYFIDGMEMVYGAEYRYSLPNNVDAAKASLRVEFWNRLLNQAEIFDLMPAAKRALARNQFQGLDCPPFDETTVRPTMQDLLQQRKMFFAERVDGIFQELSKRHVSNSPSAFRQRMIIADVYDKDGYLSESKSAVISDLRGVVGRLTGRGEPSDYGTRQLLGRVYRNHVGKRVAIDGGAFTMVAYKAGTVHFEVAPEVAIELNSILANLYPLAIPAEFRTQPKKSRMGSFDLKVERLSMGVIDLFTNIERKHFGHSMYVYQRAQENIERTIEILESIGGTCKFSSDKSTVYIDFDYDPIEVLNQIIFTGVVPEQASYQFYATKGSIGEVAASCLDIREGLRYCEPSAGTGDLARFLPKESTLCIELADVRVKVLEAKGYNVIKADFLKWADENQSERFDRILLNPPFSKGRALAHLQAAASLLTTDGRLVAILPASMVNTRPLSGFVHDWSEVFVDQFEGTCVRVVILTVESAL